MAQRNDDYLSFDKALMELRLRSEELRRMVSEGEIRAFREGETMKFKREDVDALAARREGEEQLVFADALEDDTGMVTEELSDADTLLAEEEIVEVTEVRTERPRSAPAVAARSRTRVEQADEAREPGWVTAAAVLCAVIMIYGVLVVYQVATKQPPDGITGIFAAK